MLICLCGRGPVQSQMLCRACLLDYETTDYRPNRSQGISKEITMEYITLMGAEQVQSAGVTIRNAAESMGSSANCFAENVDRMGRILQEHANRIEKAMEPVVGEPIVAMAASIVDTAQAEKDQAELGSLRLLVKDIRQEVNKVWPESDGLTLYGKTAALVAEVKQARRIKETATQEETIEAAVHVWEGLKTGGLEHVDFGERVRNVLLAR
jgi:hypothetical protein